MLKNLNNEKDIINDEYLINKFNLNSKDTKEFGNELSYNKNNKEAKDINTNINNLENDIEEIDSLDNEFLNDSLENEENISFKNEEILDKDNIDDLYTTIISNKRKSILERNNNMNRKMTNCSNTNSNCNSNKISNLNSITSTQNQTNNKKYYNENKNIFDKKDISEFKYEPFINININTDNKKDKDSIVQKINKNITFFKNWLSSINLSFYYENFINNEIYEIDQLIKISKQKTRQELFSFINSIIKPNKSGHIYRILVKIDIEAGFIHKDLSNFLTPKKLPITKNHSKNKINSNYTENELLISGIKNVFCSNNQKEEKNNIKIFLEKYNMKKLYSNFMNNGFDILEFIVLQMFSRFPVNDYILEKNLQINDYNDRKNIMEILNNEVNKINKMMNSEEYLAYTINRRIKYEDLLLNTNNNDEYLIMNDDKGCGFCYLF